MRPRRLSCDEFPKYFTVISRNPVCRLTARVVHGSLRVTQALSHVRSTQPFSLCSTERPAVSSTFSNDLAHKQSSLDHLLFLSGSIDSRISAPYLFSRMALQREFSIMAFFSSSPVLISRAYTLFLICAIGTQNYAHDPSSFSYGT